MSKVSLKNLFFWIFAAVLVGNTLFYFWRSDRLAAQPLPPLVEGDIRIFFDDLNMSDSLLKYLRGFEQVYISGDFKEAYNRAVEFKNAYGTSCIPCSFMILDTAIHLQMPKNELIESICTKELEQTHGIPRLKALCTYYRPELKQEFTQKGIEFDPWRYAISVHSVPQQ